VCGLSSLLQPHVVYDILLLLLYSVGRRSGRGREIVDPEGEMTFFVIRSKKAKETDVPDTKVIGN
jgi:hypothetical protein